MRWFCVQYIADDIVWEAMFKRHFPTAYPFAREQLVRFPIACLECAHRLVGASRKRTWNAAIANKRALTGSTTSGLQRMLSVLPS